MKLEGLQWQSAPSILIHKSVLLQMPRHWLLKASLAKSILKGMVWTWFKTQIHLTLIRKPSGLRHHLTRQVLSAAPGRCFSSPRKIQKEIKNLKLHSLARSLISTIIRTNSTHYNLRAWEAQRLLGRNSTSSMRPHPATVNSHIINLILHIEIKEDNRAYTPLLQLLLIPEIILRSNYRIIKRK